jgi:hypothetical protein
MFHVIVWTLSEIFSHKCARQGVIQTDISIVKDSVGEIELRAISSPSPSPQDVWCTAPGAGYTASSYGFPAESFNIRNKETENPRC